MTAAPIIPAPINRPKMGRAPASDGTFLSAIKLPPKESHPEHECDEDGQTRIDQGPPTHIGIESGADEYPPSEQGRRNPDQSAQHPGREERTNNVNLGSHAFTLL